MNGDKRSLISSDSTPAKGEGKQINLGTWVRSGGRPLRQGHRKGSKQMHACAVYSFLLLFLILILSLCELNPAAFFGIVFEFIYSLRNINKM